LLGDWWTPLVLREAFYGVRRFADFQESLGIARNILTQRLQRLVREGLLERRLYQDHPPRYEYRLTDKGRDFYPVMAAIVRWGDRWLDEGKGPPVLLRHRGCGHVTQAEVVCGECKQPLHARDITVEPGPGYPRDRLRSPAAARRFNAASSPV
jgi:DNA-binding HxlR family transcriptional regulator